MKKYLLYCLSFIFYNTFAQLGGFGSPYVIDEDIYATDLKVAKINNGGLLDVVLVDFNRDLVVWYDNTNGNGQFGTQHIISQNISSPRYLEVADIDGDNRLDVIVSFGQNATVAWFENLDSQGNFSNAHIITTNNAFDSDDIKAVDVDGDNDIDVVWASSDDSKLVWFENLDGQGSFSNEKIISSSTVGVYNVSAADIDGDGDMDVVCNSSSSGYPSWFENMDGQGTFGTEKMIDFIGTLKLIPADIDNDGDLDLFKFDANNGTVVLRWLKNNDGLGTFVEGRTITNLQQVNDMFPVDIDNDGDLDLVVSFVGDGKVAWFENLDGLGTFGSINIIEDNLFSARGVYGAKIDSDNYNDIVVSTIKRLENGLFVYKLLWYKNQTYLGVEDQPLQNLALYPNPTQDVLHLKNPNGIAVKQVQVYNMLGKKVLETAPVNNSIDVSALQSGLYMIKISTTNGVKNFKMVKK